MRSFKIAHAFAGRWPLGAEVTEDQIRGDPEHKWDPDVWLKAGAIIEIASRIDLGQKSSATESHENPENDQEKSE